MWAGAFAGDMLSFLIGRRLGRGFLDAHGDRLRIGPAQRERTERFFERHGGKAILLGRFVGVLRALTPFVAGTSGSRCGACCPTAPPARTSWATTFTLVGYALRGLFRERRRDVTRIVMVAALLVGVGLAATGRAAPEGDRSPSRNA